MFIIYTRRSTLTMQIQCEMILLYVRKIRTIYAFKHNIYKYIIMCTQRINFNYFEKRSHRYNLVYIRQLYMD